MAQFGRPDSDVSIGGWGSPPLWSKLNEVIPDDAQFVLTPNNPQNELFEVGLTDVLDPQVNTGHVLRFRIGKDSDGGRTMNFIVELVQGTTVIMSTARNNVGLLATYSQPLSGAEADAITDYNDLRVRVEADVQGGGGPRSARCAWLEFEVPDGTSPPVTRTTSLSAYVQRQDLVLTTSLTALIQDAGITRAVDLNALVALQGATVAPTVDAMIAALGETAAAALDAELSRVGITLNTALAAYLSLEQTGAVDLDAFVTALGITADATLDAAISGTDAVAVAFDGIMTSRETIALDLGAVIQAVFTSGVGLDSVLVNEAEQTGRAAFLNAALAALGITTGTSVDAYVSMPTTRGFVADAMVQGQASTGLSADAYLTAQIGVSVALGAALQRAMTTGLAADAVLTKPALTAGTAFDAIAVGMGHRTASLDALILDIDVFRMAALDALISSLTAQGTAFDALLVAEGESGGPSLARSVETRNIENMSSEERSLSDKSSAERSIP